MKFFALTGMFILIDLGTVTNSLFEIRHHNLIADKIINNVPCKMDYEINLSLFGFCFILYG